MKSILFLALIVQLSSFKIYAGVDRKGNGGDGLLIDGKPYLLDLVESGLEYGPYFDYNVPIMEGLESKLKSRLIFEDKRQTDPNTCFPYRKLATKISEIFEVDKTFGLNFIRALEFFSWRLVNPVLIDIPDEDYVIIDYDPKNLVQLAVVYSNTVRINRDLWSQMDDGNKVALIVHEVVNILKVYARSHRVREVTAYLMSKDLLANGESGLEKMLGGRVFYNMEFTFISFGFLNDELIRRGENSLYYSPKLFLSVKNFNIYPSSVRTVYLDSLRRFEESTRVICQELQGNPSSEVNEFWFAHNEYRPYKADSNAYLVNIRENSLVGIPFDIPKDIRGESVPKCVDNLNKLIKSKAEDFFRHYSDIVRF